MSNRIAIFILITGFIGGTAAVSYGNGKNFQVEILGPGGFRITSLQPGPISSQTMGTGSSKLLNSFENGKMVIYAWLRPGGTLLVSTGNHQLRITVDHLHQYKIEEDPH
jgi:hypothetical protein